MGEHLAPRDRRFYVRDVSRRLRIKSRRWLWLACLAACSSQAPTTPHEGRSRAGVFETVDTPFPDVPEPLTACPPEAAIELAGTPASETIHTTEPATCVDAGSGDDLLAVLLGHDRSTVLAGPGHDTVKIDADVLFARVSLGNGDDHFEGYGGATAVWAGDGKDNVEGGPGPDIFDGGADNDTLIGGGGDDLLLGARGNDIIVGGPGSDIIEGGLGSDIIEGSDGADLLFGGPGLDHILGGFGADLLEGGDNADRLEGGPGDDRLLAHAGDDDLNAGKGADLLIPGAGVDVAFGGEGDDLFVVMDACQVQRGERLDGGPGHDTLLTPLSLEELDSVGVDVVGFEMVRQFPADGFGCEPEKCDCGNFEHGLRIRRAEMCDYSSPEYELTPQERADAEDACNAMLDELPTMLDTLPSVPTAADFEAMLPQDWHKALAPTRVAQFGSDGRSHEPPFPPTTPLPNIDTSIEPCDMPQLDLHIGVARGGINNCTGAEKEEINEALDHAQMMLFRMRQQIDAVAQAPSQAEAEALWEQGSADGWERFALSNWFGTYDGGRVAAVRSTVAELEKIFYADDDPLVGVRHNVQCYHRMKWWQYLLHARLEPSAILLRTVANSCFYPNEVAHASFAVPGVGRLHAATVYYPFESVELCERAFDDDQWDPPEVLGGIIMHELLHFHRNSTGWLKDRHGSDDDGICDGPCYLEPFAEALAQEAPNTAVVNIDNYRTWANATHTLYTDGYCDDTDPGVCFPSDCCGDGILQTDLSENCDEEDFGSLSCLSVAGLTEGGLTCSADCQEVTSEACDGSCGNDAIDPALGEDCDGSDFGGVTCTSLFGSEMGSLSCKPSCSLDTSACEGTFPASYFECGVALDSPCLQDPEACHADPVAGTCTGGPCMRTDPTARTAGQLDPNAVFHPRGNFRDEDGHLYRCDAGPSGPRSCVDEDGFGVCRECGTGDGQTTLGCPCVESEDCGLDLTCFGGQYPHGGFCWPADQGPPDFHCAEGGCGQEFWGPDGGAYCEHYPPSGPARCMPQRCDDVPARACAEQDLICDINGPDCADECQSTDDCDVGWPTGTICTNNTCLTL